VYLARQRPPTGFTGRILHTYEFGRSWGPVPAVAPQWDEGILAMLREAGIDLAPSDRGIPKD
jgi:hypothetical protein